MNRSSRVTIDPAIAFGKTSNRGLRYAVGSLCLCESIHKISDRKKDEEADGKIRRGCKPNRKRTSHQSWPFDMTPQKTKDSHAN
jgi:hypothetical protein